MTVFPVIFDHFKEDYLMIKCPYELPDSVIKMIEDAMLDVSLDTQMRGQFEEQFAAFMVKFNQLNEMYDITEEFFDYLKQSMFDYCFYQRVDCYIKG